MKYVYNSKAKLFIVYTLTKDKRCTNTKRPPSAHYQIQ